MNMVCIAFGILFSVIGLLFATGKLLPYVTAWKRMPQEEKNKIKEIPLCRNIGEIIALAGILFLFKGLFPSFRDHWFTGAMIAWLIVAGLDVCFISRSNRYKK